MRNSTGASVPDQAGRAPHGAASSTASPPSGDHPSRRPWPLGGYAPGGYTGHCVDCGKEWIDQDKRSWQCLECAAHSAKVAFIDLRSQYDELLFAVARKYDGESRHETALRYIRERENGAKPASGTLTEGGDAKQAPGDSLSGAVAESETPKIQPNTGGSHG